MRSSATEGCRMDSVYKVIEVVGTSEEGWEKAAQTALGRVRHSLRGLRIAEVTDQDIHLDEEGEIIAYRVKLKVSFKYEED